MECLESLAGQAKSVPDAESVPAVILDGAAIVHMLDPKKSRLPVRTLQDYSKLVFLPYVKNVLKYCLGCLRKSQSECASTTEVLVIVSE